MGFWDISRQIFNCLCDNASQSVRRLALQTGLSKSSVHRLCRLSSAATVTRNPGYGKPKRAGSGCFAQLRHNQRGLSKHKVEGVDSAA